MDENIKELMEDYEWLKKQVHKEYKLWLEHVATQRSQKRNLMNKLIQQPDKVGKVYSRLFWRYMKLHMAINILDWIIVTFTPQITNNFESSEIASKTNKVAKFDYEAMKMFFIDFEVKWNIWFYWLWIKWIVWWDVDEKIPLVESIDPLSVIPDPNNYIWSDMRFIWFERRENIYDLTEDKWFFDVDEIISRKWQTSIEVQENISSRQNAFLYPVWISDEWLVDIYYHYTCYKGKKYLSVWLSDRNILIKIVELKPKTKAEKRNPNKIKYPVYLYRSNPVPWLFFWISLWDEIWQFQDVETILDNLEMILARKNAMWEDKFVNTSVVDIKTLQSKKPWWRYIWVKLEEWDNIWNNVFSIPNDNPWNLPEYVSQKITRKTQETTWLSDVAFWVSPQGNQTKWEIQTLQQNLNQFLSYMTQNIMKTEKEFWGEWWYRYYVYNLSARSKKFISLTTSWDIADQYEFKRNEFILDVPVIVQVKSKAQEDAKKEKKFAKMQMIMWTILPNLKPWSYAFNEMLRKYLEFGWLERSEIMTYMWYNADEIEALDWLDLINMWIKPNSPEQWQDYETFIRVYSLAKDSSIKTEIVNEYLDALKQQNKLLRQQWMMPQPEWWQVDNVARWQVWNMIAQEQANQNPSLQDVTQA